MRRATSALRVLAAAGAVLATAGCEAVGNFFDSDDPPIAGERLSVLALEAQLSPDLDPTDVEVMLPPPEPNRDWPQAGGLSHHAMHHMVLPDLPQRAWRAEIGSGTDDRRRLLAEPIAVGDGVFTIDNDAEVRAFDAETGRRRWAVRLAAGPDREPGLNGGGIGFDRGLLFATTGFGAVVALDPVDGSEVWRTRVEGPIRAAPTLNGGRVFVQTLDNRVIALAARDGRELWTFAGISEDTTLLGAPSPAVDGGILVAAFSNGEVHALRVDTGTQLWSDALSTRRRPDAVSDISAVRARPVMDRGLVFVVGHGDLITAIDLRTGLRVWEREIGGIRQPWIAGDYLFVISNAGELLAMEARTGRIVWIAELGLWEDPDRRRSRITWAGPLLASDRLIVLGSHERALAISPYDGALLGGISLPDGVTLPPVVANGTLYILTDDAELLAYR